MPELPEVETVRAGLAPILEGRRFRAVRLARPDLRFPFPEQFAERLTGARLLKLRRRAKYLVGDLDTGESWIAHLGMTGRFTVEAAGAARGFGEYVYATGADPRHDHIVFDMEDGVRVVFNDPRRFGFMDLRRTDALDRVGHFAGLGPEPLGNGFSGPVLAAALAGRRTPIKAALLDQTVVAGLGNIYVCEALHRAGVSPLRLAANVGPARAARLAQSVRAVLAEAIAAGGSTLRDFAAADGSLGAFQDRFLVYGRAGEACLRPGCAGIVRRLAQSGRSTFYCGGCQR
jgi:formamidopyrimidine-DNA glycosylase